VHATPVPQADYLGAAEVVSVAGRSVEVRLPDGAVAQATMALALPYEAEPGDLLLVIGKEDAYFVIGVIAGTGRTTLTLPGDVDLRAANGKLRLRGDEGLELLGPELEIRTGKLRMIADAVVHQFSSLSQRVARLLSVHAGEAHTVVDGAQVTQAQSAAMITEGTMTLNGKQIHLG
jgi:hypothetical protein